MMQDDDDNDDPMILNIRAKNHTSERTIVPWTVIFLIIAMIISVIRHGPTSLAHSSHASA